ncbi:MAG: XRE family transcriptional regulator [Anaerolineales bacterium]|jgi:transcriptional regulator with XRE-family HTH domain
MQNGQSYSVGDWIRKIRVQRGISQRALAQKSDLSANAISRIERGESSPTVTSLRRIADALEVSIVDFFDSQDKLSKVLVRKGGRLRTRGEGVLIESLGSGLPGQMLEPFLVTLSPGAISGETPISHAGEEFVFCLQGTIEYLVEDEWQTLRAGDSLLFQSAQPHLCRNESAADALVLMVILAAQESVRLSPHEHLLISGGGGG